MFQMFFWEFGRDRMNFLAHCPNWQGKISKTGRATHKIGNFVAKERQSRAILSYSKAEEVRRTQKTPSTT